MTLSSQADDFFTVIGGALSGALIVHDSEWSDSVSQVNETHRSESLSFIDAAPPDFF
jgi:hypothetical protein